MKMIKIKSLGSVVLLSRLVTLLLQGIVSLKASHKYTALILMAIILPMEAWGFDDDATRKSLKYIKGVGVTVGYLYPELQEAGLTKERIQAEAELKLGETKLAVINNGKSNRISGSPMLIISPNILTQTSDKFAYTVSIKLIQKVYLERNKEYISSETWSSSSVGLSSDLNDLIKSIEYHTDKFINAWQTVNPDEKIVKSGYRKGSQDKS